jgi:ectoine hydroxylase
LDNIQVGSGELLAYPGSHEAHYVISKDFESNNIALQLSPTTRKSYENRIEELIQQHACAGRPFLAKQGDVLIWHADLLHAGSPILGPQLTRHTLLCGWSAAVP